MGLTPGKVSWFGGPGDPTAGNQTASGAPISEPGMAVYDHATLGGYWLVKMPNGREGVVKQTDIGPAPWTGRKYDFTYSVLSRFGYTTGNFPTDATAYATYLGKSIPSQYAHLATGQAGVANNMAKVAKNRAKGGTPGAPGNFSTSSTSVGAAMGLQSSLLSQLEQGADFPIANTTPDFSSGTSLDNLLGGIKIR